MEAGSQKSSEVRSGEGVSAGEVSFRSRGGNKFWVGNEKFRLSPSEFQSPLGSSCSAVHARLQKY